MHLDVDGLHRSTVAQAAFNRAVDRWPALAAQLSVAKQRFGLNLAQDLHSMTVFHPRSSPRRAVLVMQADWAAATFREKLAGAANHSIVAYGPHEIHCFTKNERGRVSPVAAALWKEGTFVFGPSSDDVKASLEVLDGKRPSLSHASPLAAEVPAGAVLLVRMIRVGDGLPVESPLLKRTERIELLCGENAGECFVAGTLAGQVGRNGRAGYAIRRRTAGHVAAASGGRSRGGPPLGPSPSPQGRMSSRVGFPRAGRRCGPTREEGPGKTLIMHSPSDTSPSNEDLAGRAQAGCMSSFEELMRRFQVPLLHFLRRVGPNFDAEDVLQETFLRAFAQLDRYHSRWRFSTWLFTIARRTSINFHRRPVPAADMEACDRRCRRRLGRSSSRSQPKAANASGPPPPESWARRSRRRCGCITWSSYRWKR